MKELIKKIILTDQQKAAIEMMKKNRIGILSGLPGSGKTTVLKEILRWAEFENLSVTQASPTGRAAKRMVESTGYPAFTIHTTLACQFNGDKFSFQFNESNPLKTDLIIIDEMSMITNELMADLMKAVDLRKTKLLLVGDFNQLPAVGAGAVLLDLIDSGIIPHVYLNKIHRNAGAIVEACAKIQAGENFLLLSGLDLEAENPVNFAHIESHLAEETLNDIKAVVCDRMPIRGYDPVWDVQIISPVNTRGELSCQSINEMLQKNLNPYGDQVGNFRIGDKIINTKNEKVSNLKKQEVMIVNGDMGKIRDFNKKNIIVEFYEPFREVILPRNDNNLLLAYAVTCHRFQGSESPVVIIPVNIAFSYFTTRQWLYTAISRAKDICITVGHASSIDRMIRNVRGSQRVTGLRKKIIDHAKAKDVDTKTNQNPDK